MQTKILGAHNLESDNTRFCCLLIDGVIAVDAGALTSNLSFKDQQKLIAVLLTHQHYDHIKDIPALAINYQEHKSTINVYATEHVYRALADHMINDIIYPNFMERPTVKPAIRFVTVEAGKEGKIESYTLLPVEVTHAIPAVGYQITSADGKSVFYTSDTGPGLDKCWEKVSPELLVIETTAPNDYEEFALKTGHLTARLLQKELENFRSIKGYIPKTVTVHMSPLYEDTIAEEIAETARNLNADIQPGYEGMEITT